jgi:NAD(P)-dependent dehydrogenase (short-subunit alcohol dehydrogenase family)
VVTDISDPKKLDQAAAEVSKVTAGSLDILILNAGSAGPETSALPPSALWVDGLNVLENFNADTVQLWQGGSVGEGD